jgi:sugar-phosphatase
MVGAVIFGVDGLLIDSEPLWREAEAKVFRKVGVDLTDEMAGQTMGLRVDEVVAYWYKRYPWETPSQEEIATQIDEGMVEKIGKKGKPKDGVNEAFAVCEAEGLPIGVASSSDTPLIMAALRKLGIAGKIQAVHSAYDETFGKPHPAVYISAAKALGIEPSHCLAFEDSANGVLATKAARMRCIAVPELELLEDKRFGIADIILPSLRDFTPHMLEEL